MSDEQPEIQTTNERDILRKARLIGFETWRTRAEGWRRREGHKVDHLWLASVKRGYEYGSYDQEDGVQSALAGIELGMKLRLDPLAAPVETEIVEEEPCQTLLHRLLRKLFLR